MAYKIHPLDAEACDVCGSVTFAWVNPCNRCKGDAPRPRLEEPRS